MKKGLCEIIVVLDRSGSMESIKHDMEGGFDNFIAEQKKFDGECKVSLYQFDTEYEAVYEGRDLASVPKCKLVPRGGTALLDALGRTINAVGARFGSEVEWDRPEKVVVLVITDGHENSSREFSYRKIKEMVNTQETNYNWKFVYLGADPSTFDEAEKMGVAMAAAYTPSPKGASKMYGVVGAAVMSYRSNTSTSASLNVARDLTTDEE